MRVQKKLVAGLSAALLTLGLAACETDPEALDDLNGEPGVEDEGGDL